MLPPQSPSVATFDSVVIAVVIVLVVVVVIVVDVIVALVDVVVVILVGVDIRVVVVVFTSGFIFFPSPSDSILSSQPTMLLRSIFN